MENIEEQVSLKTGKSWVEKIFFIIFFMLLIGSVAFTYYKIVLKKNYLIEAQVDCDPETERCFVWECDPESVEEGEVCTGDPEVDIWYYKLVTKNAGNIPLCNPEEDENCTPLVCEEGEVDCAEILCNDENKLEQGAECNDPEEYLFNNPPEEEEEAIEEEEAVESEDIDGAEEAENTDAVDTTAVTTDAVVGEAEKAMDVTAESTDNVSPTPSTNLSPDKLP